jgi:hypothetical protein
MGDRQSVEDLQWLGNIGRRRNNVIHSANGREVQLDRVPNLKVHGHCLETKDVFEYLGCFWIRCPCMPYRHEPIGNTGETLLSRYEEKMARLQKIRDAGYKVFSIWECEFKQILYENPGLENELRPHTYVTNSPINIRDALYRSRTKATRTWYRNKEGEEILYMNVISLYPTSVNTVSFQWAIRRCTWAQTVLPTAWIGRGLSDVRFYLIGRCIIY